MELNWSTFVLEIINFLVLVWILKHFLYRPVLGIIARRREAIEQQQQQAQLLRQEAEGMREQYDQRLAQWQQEQQQARADLQQVLNSERQEQQAKLQQELAETRRAAAVADQRRLQDALAQYQQLALQQAAQFAARLLQQGAGPEAEARLTAMLVEQVDSLTAEQRTRLQRHNGERSDRALVSSAYPLAEAQRQQLRAALQRNLPEINTFEWQQDPQLLAGVRIAVGAWELGCNLADELRGFAELAFHD